MKKFYGILAYIVSCILCVLAGVSGVELYIDVAAVPKEAKQEAVSTEIPESEVIIEKEEAEEQEQVQVQSSAPSSTPSSAPAAADIEAKGKIVEQVMAHTSGANYEGVHIRDLTGTGIDIAKYVKAKPSVSLKNTDKPQVLVLHTHATESYMSDQRDYYTESDKFRSTDNSKNIVAIGKTFCETLEKQGIKTVQIKTQFDSPAYTGSYSRAKDEINAYLKKYPSIKVVVDIHRDSVSSGTTKTKPTVKINGKKAAQVMLVMGSGTGSVKNFPKWEKNLALAADYQQAMAKNYPSFARCMMISSKLYNQNLTTGSMLIEIGTEVNTFDEANYSATLAATALASVLGK